MQQPEGAAHLLLRVELAALLERYGRLGLRGLAVPCPSVSPCLVCLAARSLRPQLYRNEVLKAAADFLSILIAIVLPL